LNISGQIPRTTLIIRCHKTWAVADIKKEVIEVVKMIYLNSEKTEVINENILNLNFNYFFDKIISFETVEHLKKEDIPILFNIYNKHLKKGGNMVFSTPYNQKECDGFHLTFNINEDMIKNWMDNTGFKIIEFKYQNYQHHDLVDSLNHKDFIICFAEKN
jgi:hypothetical protein